MMEKRLEAVDLNLLLALHWLLAEQNVTAAADKLGMSQPAASRALARLRQIFDDPLLVKSGAGMTPTRLAEALQPAVERAIEQCRDVFRVTDDFDATTITGSFCVACVDYIGVYVAEAWMRSVQHAAPGLDLDIIRLSIEASRDLISGKIDLVVLPDPAILTLPPSLDVDQFVRKKIFRQEFMCALRKGHPDADNRMTLKRFVELQHILVAPEGHKRGVVDDALDAKGLTRRVAYRTASFLSALPLLQRTDCVITAPHALLRLGGQDVVIFPPPVEVSGADIFVAWHPNWTNDPRHIWVRNRLSAAMADLAL